MEKIEQHRLVLAVLLQMRDCVDNDTTYTTILGKPFNLTRQLGICWHVFAHTPHPEISGIGSGYLEPFFIALGLDGEYPVECQVQTKSPMALHFSQRNLYDPDTECGKLRYKLLTQLIQYFEKEIACVV